LTTNTASPATAISPANCWPSDYDISTIYPRLQRPSDVAMLIRAEAVESRQKTGSFCIAAKFAGGCGDAFCAASFFGMGRVVASAVSASADVHS
jgi:hypothetical protein